MSETPRPRKSRVQAMRYACNVCGANSDHDDMLDRCAGRACPYCGEGVIQEDSDAR